jgi:hypothetical protein
VAARGWERRVRWGEADWWVQSYSWTRVRSHGGYHIGGWLWITVILKSCEKGIWIFHHKGMIFE